MKKKLLSLLASSFIVIPFLSFSAGLGSVRTHSNLNERLRAEIPVLSVKKRGKMSVALASDAVFSQRGMARGQDVRNLRFSLIKKAQRYYVKVSSIKPVSTPYLNFILELSDEDGKAYREYAIFLDPVSSKNKKQSLVSHRKELPNKASQKVKREPVVSKATNKKERKNTKKQTKKRRVAIPVVAGKVGYYGPVKRGETLTRIALRVRPSKDISVYNMIRLLEEANPRLKYGLKADSTLKIPTIKGYPTYQKDTEGASSAKINKQEKSIPAPIASSKKAVRKDNAINIDTIADKKTKQTSQPITTKVINRIEDSVVVASAGQSDTEKVKVETANPEETINNNSASVVVQDSTENSIPLNSISETTNNKEGADSTQVVTTETMPTDVADANTTSKTPTVSEPKLDSAVLSDNAESDKDGFSLPFDLPLMPLLAGAGTLLLGLLALLFVRRKRQSEETQNIVLLDEDDTLLDDEQVLAVDNSVSVDKETINKEAIIMTANTVEEVTELESFEVNENGLPLDDDAEEAYEEEEPFKPELFDLDNEGGISTSKPTSVLSNEVISESKEKVETLENITDNNALSFDLEECSEEMSKKEDAVEEVSDSSDDNMLDFNLDEFSQTEIQEDTNIQSVESAINDETVSSDTDDGLTFEVNDNFTDDLSEEATKVSDEFVSDVNSIDFELDKDDTVADIESAVNRVDEDVLGISNDNNLTQGSGHTEVEMKLAMAETFISISNTERAQELLQQVIQEGTAEQVEKAKSILKGIS